MKYCLNFYAYRGKRNRHFIFYMSILFFISIFYLSKMEIHASNNVNQTQNSNKNIYIYEYDANGRLVKVKLGDSNANFVYDYLNNILKNVSNQNSGGSDSGNSNPQNPGNPNPQNPGSSNPQSPGNGGSNLGPSSPNAPGNSNYSGAQKDSNFPPQNGSNTPNHSQTPNTANDQKTEEMISKLTDIKNHWAKADIEFVIKKGIFVGTTEKTFSPNLNITRGMIITVLGRLSKEDISKYGTSKFTDVSKDKYYSSYIQWATEKGIVNGISKHEFAPNSPLTREQLAVILRNYINVMNIKLAKTNPPKEFSDSSKISPWAKDSVGFMYDVGIINGNPGNKFEPKREATRAEIAVVLRRLIEKIQ